MDITWYQTEPGDMEIIKDMPDGQRLLFFAARIFYRCAKSVELMELLTNPNLLMDYYAKAFQTRMSRQELYESCMGAVSAQPEQVLFNVPKNDIAVAVDLEDRIIVVTQFERLVKIDFDGDGRITDVGWT